ncbi:lasso peptide biosynthesis B2 protein [Microbacterium lacticum]
MSDLVLNAQPRGRTSVSDRLRARVVVVVARALAAVPPDRLVRALSRISRGAGPADMETAARARDAVLTVSVRCSGRYCLDRSIAIALWCRLKGSWPQWYSGIATEPFRAHAWVSVDGVPVGEPEAVQQTFIPTLQVLPTR